MRLGLFNMRHNLAVFFPVRKMAVLVFALLFFFAGQTPHVVHGAPIKLAIVEFDAVNQPAKAGGWGRLMAEMCITAAVNTGSFEVVERHLLEKIMSEQSMGARETGFASVAQSIGNMVGADYLLSGSVMKMDNQVRVDARLVDVASGAIITAQSVNSSSNLGKLSKKIDNLLATIAESVYGGAPPQAGAGAQGVTPGGAPAVAGKPLSLTVQHAAGDGLTIPLSEGDALSAQDGYFLEITTGQKLYVYAVQIDATGAMFGLFPNAAFSSVANPMSPGSTYRIPSAEVFQLDENSGTETILVLAGVGPIEQAERVFANLENADPFAMEDLVNQFRAAMDAATSEMKQSLSFIHR